MKKIFAPQYLAALLLILTLSACEKVIEFDGDETQGYLVMISKPDTENSWKVRLTESRFFLSEDTISSIKNAALEITVNGVVTPTTVTNCGKGLFDLGYTPQPGDSLTLQVTVPGKGTMSAGCRIPSQPVVSSVSCTYDTTHYISSSLDSTEMADGTTKVAFTLHDPADETNYYLLRVLMPTLEYCYDDYTYDTAWVYQNIQVDDNVIFDMEGTDDLFGFGSEEYYGDEVLFTDERINGQSHTINLEFYLNGVVGEKCYLEVLAVGRDRYLFERTLAAARRQDTFTRLISEPVQIHSNVTGGLGILGGSAVTKITLK